MLFVFVVLFCDNHIRHSTRNNRPANTNKKPKATPPKHVGQDAHWANVILDEYLRHRVLNVVDVMIQHDDWRLWFAPVDTSLYTDYTKTIKQPMDYGTLKYNIGMTNKYDTLYDIYKEFILIYDNEYLYNKHERRQIYDKTTLTEILFQLRHFSYIFGFFYVMFFLSCCFFI